MTTAATRLFLVRHGATQLTAEDRFSGVGRRGALGRGAPAGARAWRERLAHEAIARRLLRARCRARSRPRAIIARPHGLAPIERDGLREISHGRWEGLTRHEVEQRFADEYAAWEEDPFTFAPEGGESGVAVLARALPVIREIVVRARGRGVLVVSHKATMRLLLSQPARLRRARLPRPTGPVARVPQRRRLQGPGARAPDALQRHLALRRTSRAAPHGNLSKWWDAPDGAKR